MSSKRKQQNKRTSGRAQGRRPAKGKATASRNRNRGDQSIMRGAVTAPTLIPSNYNLPRSGWMKTRQVRVQGELVTEIWGCTPAFFVRRTTSGGTPNQQPFQYINQTGTVRDLIVVHPCWLFPATSTAFATANSHSEFRFLKASMSYDARAGTSNNGSFLLAYYPDGGIQDGQLGSSQNVLYAMPGCVSIPVWASGPKTDFSQNLGKNSWYYVDFDDTSDASRRQSYQGGFMGLWDTAPPSDGYWGYIFMDFVCQLRNPRPILDLTLQVGKPSRSCRDCRIHDKIAESNEFKRKAREKFSQFLRESKSFHSGSEEDLPAQSVIISNASPLEVEVQNSSLDVEVKNSDPIEVDVKSSVPVDSNIASIGSKEIKISIVGDLDGLPVCGSEYATTYAPLSVQGNVQAEVYNDSEAPLFVDQVPGPSSSIRPQPQPSAVSGMLPSISTGSLPMPTRRVEGKSQKSAVQIPGPPKK